MSKYLASVFRNKMFVIFDVCAARGKNYMSNFVCRSLTFQTPEEAHTHAHTHTLTLQITYCLVKQKFFITFHKLRLFIRDHNFVLCIFFIPNIFRTAPSSFRASLIFFSIFLLFSKAHTLSLSLSFSLCCCLSFYMLARKLKLCYYFA